MNAVQDRDVVPSAPRAAPRPVPPAAPSPRASAHRASQSPSSGRRGRPRVTGAGRTPVGLAVGIRPTDPTYPLTSGRALARAIDRRPRITLVVLCHFYSRHDLGSWLPWLSVPQLPVISFSIRLGSSPSLLIRELDRSPTCKKSNNNEVDDDEFDDGDIGKQIDARQQQSSTSPSNQQLRRHSMMRVLSRLQSERRSAVPALYRMRSQT